MKNVIIVVIAPAHMVERILTSVARLLEDYAGLLTVTEVERCIGLRLADQLKT